MGEVLFWLTFPTLLTVGWVIMLRSAENTVHRYERRRR